jgi:hypothetical protein
MTITHSPIDLILKRFDKSVIAEYQGKVLVNYISDWLYYQPVPNQSSIVRGEFTLGSYCKLYSPILSNTNDLDTELKKVYDGIEKFIQYLNSEGKTVSRLECWIDQSDDMMALLHPSNDTPDMFNRYQTNQDYKNGSWLFNDIFKTHNSVKQTVYGNKFDREINNFKPTKKYFVLRIESSWLSI